MNEPHENEILKTLRVCVCIQQHTHTHLRAIATASCIYENGSDRIVNIVTAQATYASLDCNCMHWHPGLVECANNFNFQLFTTTFLIKLRKRKLSFSFPSANVCVYVTLGYHLMVWHLRNQDHIVI